MGHCRIVFLFFDILSIGSCTTRDWQTSGRLVQEFNVCTVHVCTANYTSAGVEQPNLALEGRSYADMSCARVPETGPVRSPVRVKSPDRVI